MLWFSFSFKETQSEIKSVCKLTVSFCAPTFLLVLLSAQKLSMGLCNWCYTVCRKKLFAFHPLWGRQCSCSGSAQVACELVLTGTHMCTQAYAVLSLFPLPPALPWALSPRSDPPLHPDPERGSQERQASPSAVVACMVCMVACKQIKQLSFTVIDK